MLDIETLFFELIQVALGNRQELSRNPSEEEWDAMFAIAQKQAIVGVAFGALDKLSARGQLLPVPLLYKWIGLVEQIKRQNLIVNQRCKDITSFFTNAGFKSCILKGQGNAQMYDNPLYRTPGDIDIWVEGDRKDIKNLVKNTCPDSKDGDMHIDFPIYNDVSVEVHYKPSFDFRPIYEKRLQKWFLSHAVEQFTNGRDFGGICVNFPTLDFNVIHQISHIMNHFFVEGIGLRHFIDYYCVLRRLGEMANQKEIGHLFHYLGLKDFAGGVMWIEKHCLALPKKYLVVEPEERTGRVILKEIIEGGNFGHFDKRYKTRNKGLLARGVADTCRLIKLMPYFPSLSLWKILSKIENQKWKF